MLAAAASVNLLAASGALAALLRAMPDDAMDRSGTPAISRGRLFEFAMPLLASNLLFQLMTDVTLFFLARYCQVEEVALYGAAYRVWGFLGLPQNAVASAIQGRISELHALNDRRGLEEMIRNSANLATLPTFLITLVVCLAAGPLLHLLFGEFYAEGSTALVVLCLSQLIFVALGPCEHLLAMSGKQRTVLAATMVSALLAVAAAWLLIPIWGIAGAATAAGLSTISFKVLLAWQAYQQMDIRSWLTLPIRDDASTPTLLSAAASGESQNLKG
jgi:O-antigen/teichoic acid export membrane protein